MSKPLLAAQQRRNIVMPKALAVPSNQDSDVLWRTLYTQPLNAYHISMKASLIGLFFIILNAQWACAQDYNAEQEIVDLSKAKWQWMSEKKADTLATLFHDNARFVHMSGTWGTDQEIEIIRSGSIHYKQADVHDVVVEMFDDTAILWNRITLLAVVRGNEVSNEFTVTEVYQKQENRWQLLGLTFSSVRDTHTIEH